MIRKEYIIKRSMMLVLVVFGVLIITFAITRLIPAHPELLWTGPRPTREYIDKAREILHLNDPVYVQFYYYLSDLLRGDWGVSYRTRMPIAEDIKVALPATLELLLFAFAFAVIVGIPLGVMSAAKRNTGIDHVVRVGSIAAASFPVFWLALVLQLVFCGWLGLFPAGGRVDEVLAIETGFKTITGFYLVDSLLQGNLAVFLNASSRIILPSLALAAYPIALTARMTRAMMTEVLQANYVRSFRAWGVPERLVRYKYALKNAVAPVIASLGLDFGYLLVGSFMIELIFAWQGIGYYAGSALMGNDFPAAIACIIIVAIFYSVINMIVDIVHSMIDVSMTL